MRRISSQALHPHFSIRLEKRLQKLFQMGDGFGLILYFWALTISLIGAVALVAVGFAYWLWWSVLAGVIAFRIYLYLGYVGRDILDRFTPFDG